MEATCRRWLVTAVKYLVVAMIVANWASVFRSVNGSFNSMANSIGSSSGAGDMFQSWMGQLQQQFANNPSLTLTDLITGDAASTITVVLLVVAYLLYALAMIFFCFFYTLFGAVLYVIGPLVLALIPISGVGQLGKAYAINVMIWNAWGFSMPSLERSSLRSRATKSTTYWEWVPWFSQGNRGFGHARVGQYLLRPGDRPDSVHCEKDHFRRCGRDGICARACGCSCNRRGLSWSQWTSPPGRVRQQLVLLRRAVWALSSTSTVLTSSTAPPAPSMPDFIRSGVASAMNSSRSPASCF